VSIVYSTVQYSTGTEPDSNDLLKIIVSGTMISSDILISSLGEISLRICIIV